MNAPLRQQIRQFVEETFLLGAAGQRIDDESSLVAAEIIDSTGFLEMIGFVESRFGVVVDEEDMVEDNFETIAAIAAFIGRKSAVAA
jgi:acyl carrier protein